MKEGANPPARRPAGAVAQRPGVAGALSLKGRALRYLSAREHSRAELQAKLARHAAKFAADGAQNEDGDPQARAEALSADITRVLDELTAKGFISEERVAESVIHRRAARLGNARVLQELRAKGVPDDIVQDAAERLRGTEQVRAHEVWARKFGRPPADLAERARQMRFMAGRGFSGAVVQRVLRQAGALDANAPDADEPDA